MRTARILTNLTCNQNCTFCTSRSGSDERAFVHPGAVRARIVSAFSTGARELILSGGEPTLRRDLAELVTFARSSGAERVVLETNGTALTEARARELKNAGLSLAQVNVSGLVAPRDRVTRDEGGHERTLAGLRALIAAGVPVSLDVAVVRSTLLGLSGLPAEISALLGPQPPLQWIQLRVPTESPEPAELLQYEEAARAIAMFDDAARRVAIQTRLAPDSGPPPCVFTHQARAAHLFSLNEGAARRDGYLQVEACGGCQMATRCPGFPRAYLDRHGTPALQPITEDRTRRRLSLIGSTAEQMRREHVQISRAESGGRVIEERIVRVNFQCNQSCRFCFVSTHLPTEAHEVTRQAILDAGAQGQKVILSGGEPTLNPRLAEYVTLARDSTKFPVNLQTNATLLGEAGAVQVLVDAGLSEVFVSLHGSTAAISDAITEAPGTFVKTVAGIDALSQAPVLLVLNFVICQRNIPDLLPYIRFVGTRWPKALVNISFVAPMSDVVPREAALIPRYSEALPQLAEAVAEAGQLGVQVVGFESMCGIPLCLVPADLAPYLRLTDIPEGFDAGEFVKPPVCQGCALEKKCYGLRRGYQELHGAGELRAVALVPEDDQRVSSSHGPSPLDLSEGPLQKSLTHPLGTGLVPSDRVQDQ